MPHSPRLTAVQNLGVPVPSGETTPVPVTATRRPLPFSAISSRPRSTLGGRPKRPSPALPLSRRSRNPELPHWHCKESEYRKYLQYRKLLQRGPKTQYQGP